MELRFNVFRQCMLQRVIQHLFGILLKPSTSLKFCSNLISLLFQSLSCKTSKNHYVHFRIKGFSNFSLS
uniref:Uncharacterized protein n=1 Tax=Helianthus annuus TaxID=4232 RepID=A0A251RPG5_HELAN